MDPRTLTDILADVLNSGDTKQQSALAKEFNEAALTASIEEKYNALVEFIALSSSNAFETDDLQAISSYMDGMIAHIAQSNDIENKFKQASFLIKEGLGNNADIHNTRIVAARLLSTLGNDRTFKFSN